MFDGGGAFDLFLVLQMVRKHGESLWAKLSNKLRAMPDAVHQASCEDEPGQVFGVDFGKSSVH